MKRYRCTQCSGHETRSLVADLLGSAPEECSNCGNREFEVGGQTRRAVATNRLAKYDRGIDLPTGDRVRAAQFTVFTTPAVEVLERTFNPVGDMSSAELARQALSRFEGLEDLEKVGDETVPILGTDAAVGVFETEATVAGDVTATVRLHVAEAVRAGSDFVVAVGGYPKLVSQADAIRSLMNAVTHTDETPS
jgi:hypothetical protein